MPGTKLSGVMALVRNFLVQYFEHANSFRATARMLFEDMLEGVISAIMSFVALNNQSLFPAAIWTVPSQLADIAL